MGRIKTIFLEAPYQGKIELNQEVLQHLQKYHKIAIYASIQFYHQLNQIKTQLEQAGIEVIKTGQLLGCSIIKDDNIDAFLYLGDGQFHPQALAYNTKKEIVCYNPKSNQYQILPQENIKNILQKQKGALTKFHASDHVGVIISLKPGQQFYQKSLTLTKKYPHKKFYYFIDNNISFDQLENFPFIDIWVNTACPRIAYDNQAQFRKGVINLRNVL